MGSAKTSSTTAQWKTFAVIAIAVILLVGAVYAVLEFQRNQPSAPVRDLTVQFEAGGAVEDVAPYTVCELDAECAGGDAPTMRLGDAGETEQVAEQITVRVPDEVASLSWRLLLIYDDPSKNEERIFQSGEAREDNAPAVTESGARLVVAEVSALTVDTDDAGEETPVIATWSMGFE